MNTKKPSKRPIGIPIPNPMIPNKVLTIPISSQSKGFERKQNKERNQTILSVKARRKRTIK